MARFWNSKERRFFKQSTALVVVAALLCSAILPPVASAASTPPSIGSARKEAKVMESFKLRKASLTMESKEEQIEELQKYQPPTASKQTLEHGIEFFQNVFKRRDVPPWMVPLVKIIYTPFLSAETWKLGIFRKEFLKFHPIKRDLHLLYFAIGSSFIYSYHSLFSLFTNQIGLDSPTSTLAALIISIPLLVFGIKIFVRSNNSIVPVIVNSANQLFPIFGLPEPEKGLGLKMVGNGGASLGKQGNVIEIKLQGNGALLFGGRYWAAFGDHKNEVVKIEPEVGVDENGNEIVYPVLVEFADGTKEHFIQIRANGQLVHVFYGGLSLNKLQELIHKHPNLTLEKFRLNKNGALLFGSKKWGTFPNHRYGEVEVELNSKGEIDVVRWVWTEKVGEEEKRFVSRLEPSFGKTQRKLFAKELLFKNQLQAGLISSGLGEYGETIADTLVRLRGKSLNLLKDQGLLAESDVEAIDHLQIDKIELQSLANRFVQQIENYISNDLDDSQINLLLSTHLFPWSFIEYLQRTYRLGRSDMSLIIKSLNYPNVEAHIKRVRETEEGRGKLDRDKHLKKYSSSTMKLLSPLEREELLKLLKSRAQVLKALREELGLKYSQLIKEGNSFVLYIAKRGRIDLRAGERIRVEREERNGNGSSKGTGYYYEVKEVKRTEDGTGWTIRLVETRDGAALDELPQTGFIDKGGLGIKLELESVTQVIENMKRSGNSNTGSKVLDRLFGLIELKESEEGKEYVKRENFFNQNIPYEKISDFKSVGDESQEEAVNLALNPTEVLFMEGPPGTGKTTVIVEIIRQAVAQGKKVLLVSQMHQAVDNVIANLMNDEGVPVARFGSDPSKLSYGVERVWIGNKATGLREEAALEFQRRRTALQAKGIDGYLYAATDIGIGTDPMFKKIIGGGTQKIFDLIIMDESSRETLTGSLVPLQHLKEDGKVIFVGDQKQLPPFGLNMEKERALVQSGISETDIESFNQSAFEWLLERSYGDRVMLSTNYRSHPLIAGIVSHLFYEGDVNRRGWEDFDRATLSLKVIDLFDEPEVYHEERNEDGSYSNKRSLEEVMRLVEGYKNKGVELREITILSPYLSQNGIILNALKKKYLGLKEEEYPLVKTIDGYQGGENRAIIFDFVRSNRERKIGFVKDLRRLNVGLSRAQENLSIIWDSRTFTGNVSEKDSSEDARARELFDELNRYYTQEVETFFPESDEMEEEDGVGGIMPIVKEWTLNLSNQFHLFTHKKVPKLSSRNYDRWFTSLFENTPAYLLSVLVGVPVYLVTQDFNIAFNVSYISTWSFIFFSAHFIPDSKGSRAPPINIGLAGMISVINLALPYVLPHILLVPAPWVIPTLLLGSYLSHQIVNRVSRYVKDYLESKQSRERLKEVLTVRKGLEHPVNNLLYALTQRAVEKNSTKPEENLILVHLDQFDEFETEGSFHFSMKGIENYIVLNEGVRVRFVKNSQNLEGEVETILQNYPMLKGFVLSSVPTPKEAIEKSKGYKIAYVVTRVPQMWKGLGKTLVVLLSGGTELIIRGNLAREVMGMMNSMGFVGADGNYWNYIRGKLTIKEKNLESEDLQKLKKPDLFKSQA